MITNIRRRAALVGAVAALAVGLAACAADETEPAADAGTATDAGTGADDETDAESMLVLQPVGEACSAIEPSGEGSSEGMADDPVATAASNNPLLTQLVDAVVATELVDTLNGAEALTVFAPYDPAFEAIADTVAGLTVDEVSEVLTLHVVGENLTLDDLMGMDSVTTLQGAELALDFPAGVEDGLPTVSAANTANVLCGNIQTANATVHLVDAVLLP